MLTHSDEAMLTLAHTTLAERIGEAPEKRAPKAKRPGRAPAHHTFNLELERATALANTFARI